MRSALLLALLALASFASAQITTLTTQTNGGTTLSSWAGANSWYFDINVTSPTGIIVNQIDTRILAGTGTFDVYVTSVGGSFVPVISTPLAWTKVGTAAMSATATGMATGLLAAPFYLATGTYGVCLHLINLQATYTNPGSPPTVPLTYSDANLTLDCTVARLRNSTTTNAFTGGTSAFPRIPNMTWSYTASAQIVNFTASPTRGPSPLQVQFTDLSFSGVPGGIVAWAWNFDGDNIPDSNLQNPVHTYTNCGDYTVSLTIVDSTGGYQTTKANYVQTDLVTADFSWQLTAANTIQFTDASTPTPATWSWDLDGDNIVDSTAPNPQFTYPPNFGETTVTLTVQLACRAPVVLTRRIVVSQALETTFQGGLLIATTSTGGTNMFDLTVSNPTGIVLNALHVNSNVPNGNALQVNLWANPTGYLNNQTVPGVWRQVATASTTSRGPGARTLVTIPGGVYFAPGTYGIAVQQIGHSPIYTNLGGARTYSNADITINAGLTMADPLFTTGTVFLNRIWNGVLYYTTASIASDAGYGLFGLGCAGTNGVPTNFATALPRLGQTMTVQMDNLPIGAAFYAIGFSRTLSLLGPLPLDLAPFGAPNCSLRVNPDVMVLAINPTGTTALQNLAIPNNLGLLGMRFYAQAASLDTPANTLGLVMSDAAAGVIGR